MLKTLFIHVKLFNVCHFHSSSPSYSDICFCFEGEELSAHRRKEKHTKQLPRKRGEPFCDEIDFETKTECVVCHK